MTWETFGTLAIGAALAAIPSFMLAWMNHRATAKRDLDAFIRENQERYRQHLAGLFSEALAVGMLMRREYEQGKALSQELEDRKATMLGRLRLEAGKALAEQWGAYVGASKASQQSPIKELSTLENMMQQHLDSISTGKAIAT